MRMYTIADAENSWHWSEHLLWQGVGIVVLVVVAGVLAGIGDNGLIATFIVAPVITLGLIWKVSRGGRDKAIAARGRYYCNGCSQHFEGDGLRQISQ